MSSVMERRIAPRFAVDCKAELASGTSVTAVDVSDMSMMGCGVEFTDHYNAQLGASGVLAIQPDEGAAPVMLPVVVANHRVAGDRTRFGLQFPRLTMAQMRDLISVMDRTIKR